jgi:hypothetical protein
MACNYRIFVNPRVLDREPYADLFIALVSIHANVMSSPTFLDTNQTKVVAGHNQQKKQVPAITPLSGLYAHPNTYVLIVLRDLFKWSVVTSLFYQFEKELSPKCLSILNKIKINKQIKKI